MEHKFLTEEQLYIIVSMNKEDGIVARLVSEIYAYREYVLKLKGGEIDG